MVCLQIDVCFEVGCIFRTQVTLKDVVAYGISDFEGLRVYLQISMTVSTSDNETVKL